MNTRAFTLSLVIAGLAAFLVWSYLDGKEATYIQQYGGQVPVVVAKVDIKSLEIIDDRKVEIKNIPKNYVAPGSYNKIEDVYNTIASTPIAKGEVLTKTRINYPGAQSGLSRQIAIGKRGFSIPVSESQAVSKLVKPGDRVDVIALIDFARGRKELMRTKTVLQDVLVISTGLSITNTLPLTGVKTQEEVKLLNLNTYTDYNTVALELSPREVQNMVFLIESGSTIYLSLRNNDDKAHESVNSTRLLDVLDTDAAEAKRFYSEQNK